MIYLKFVWNSIKRRKKRTAFLLISMTLSLSFLIALVTFMSSYIATMNQENMQLYGDFDTAYSVSADQPASLAEQSGFERIGHLYNIGHMTGKNAKNSFYAEMGAIDSEGFELSCLQLKEGRMPQKSGEVVMTENALLVWTSDRGIEEEISVGDSIEISFQDIEHLNSDNQPNHTETLVLTGILKEIYEDKQTLQQRTM